MEYSHSNIKLTLNACASHRIIRSKLAWGLKGKKGLCLSSDPQVLLDCEFRIISLTQFPQLNLTSKWKAMSLDPAGVSWMFTVNLQKKNKRKTFKTFRGPGPTEQWRAEHAVCPLLSTTDSQGFSQNYLSTARVIPEMKMSFPTCRPQGGINPMYGMGWNKSLQSYFRTHSARYIQVKYQKMLNGKTAEDNWVSRSIFFL